MVGSWYLLIIHLHRKDGRNPFGMELCYYVDMRNLILNIMIYSLTKVRDHIEASSEMQFFQELLIIVLAVACLRVVI
jgi:hypothetical protein